MAPIRIALVFAFLLAGGCIQGQPEKAPVLERGLAAGVIDGDTIALESGQRVRLIGIDTPEKGMPCWEEAKNRLQGLVFGKQLILKRDISETDKYGRLVRYVYANGTLVTLALVQQGLALAYDSEPYTTLTGVFHAAEERAKAEKVGCLWK